MNLVVKYVTLLIIGLVAGLIAGGLGTSTAYALILGLVFTGVSKDYKHAAALTLFTGYEYMRKGIDHAISEDNKN